MSNKANVFFEIETINRELDFRLFLAALCAKPDTRIYVGHHDTIFDLIEDSRDGLYVGKNFRPTCQLEDHKRHGRYRILKERGHKLIWLDEEGGVFWGERPDWEQMMLQSLDPQQLAAEDQVCTWGDTQRDFYRSGHPACESNIQTTGHPRFDLYKEKYRGYFERDAARLRERYGNFLLVNTNFHRANTAGGLKIIFGPRKRAFNPSNRDRYYMLERWLHINNVLTNFVKVITRLSLEMPELNIVIRPHPSENIDFYRNIFDGLQNVHALHEGSVGTWLFACRAMMHDGCTTAIEGHFSGVPVINYKPEVDERFDIPLPNLFGVRCHNEEQALEMMHGLLHGKRPVEEERTAQEKQAKINETAPRLIANFYQDAFELISAKIDNVVQGLPPAPAPVKLPGRSSRPSLFVRKKSEKAPASSAKKPKQIEAGRQPKFYGLHNAAIPERMETIQRMLGREISYVVLSDELMCIEG